MTLAKRSFALPVAALVAVFCFHSTVQALNLQTVGPSARSVALGGSTVALADNTDAIFENPAGLGKLAGRQVSYTNVMLFYTGTGEDSPAQHVIGIAQPLGGRLGLGLGIEYIGIENFNEIGGTVSLAYKLSNSLNLGLNAKYLSWSATLADGDPGSSSGGNVGVDVGALWKSPFKGAQVGLLVKNLNKPNVAGGDVPGEPDAGTLPMDLHVGIAYWHQATTSLISVQWVARAFGEDASSTRLLLGAETQLAPGFMLRAGGSRYLEDDEDNLNAGLGWQRNKLGIDYAYHIPLGLEGSNGKHLFTFAYDF